MNIEELQSLCKNLPAVTEDVKWGHDLVFSIGGKMFVVVGLSETPTTASFKVSDEEFDEISSREGFMPAPYLARHKWVHINNVNKLSKAEWKKYLKQSYELVKEKLPARTKKQLGI
jgi:predicted DNA-binding protein (MmcQ/YjbR family)